MITKLLNIWFTLRSSLWFVPTLMTIGAVALSFVTIFADEAFSHNWLQKYPSIYSGGPEGARAVLATIAGSMIGVTSIVFSLTVVTLTLASSQFGPRLLRNFMRDLGNQIVLGTFIATFIYCLLILRVVRDLDEDKFVPYISVTMGIAMALASLGVLIYFIHHVSVSIQANVIVAGVSDDLLAALERLFPERLGQGLPTSQEPDNVPSILAETQLHARTVMAGQSGYLQVVDSHGLMHMATTHDLLIHLHHRPGDFVVQACPLLTVWPGTRVDDILEEALNRAFILGSQGTDEQDIRFAFQQLVEVAVRALSPGINDPFTAVACLDRITTAFCLFAARVIPSPNRYDAQERLRVVAPPVTFVDVTETVITPIRQYSRSSILVTIRLLDMLTTVAAHVHRDEDREALRQQAVMVLRGSHEVLSEEGDRQQVKAHYEAAVEALTPPP